MEKLLNTIRGLRSRGASPQRPFSVESANVGERLSQETKLHLGCGPNVLDGWANVDLEGSSPVIRWDLAKALPIAPGAIEYIYSEHFIEHIPRSVAENLLSSCYRALRKNGVIRLSTPSLEFLLKEYQSGRLSEWANVHWHPRTPCQLVNEGMRLWGHQFIYDYAELTKVLKDAGFETVIRAKWRQSAHPMLRDLESRPFHNELILEAIK